MVKKIKHVLKKWNPQRTSVLLAAFLLMALVLIHRIFQLQIIDGQKYADNFSLRTTKTRTIKSTRGSIYDRNGNILASNELSYSITLEDSGTYDNNRHRNLSLNGEIYKLIKMIEGNGNKIDSSFHIVLDENGRYQFDVKGFALDRFKADVYGYSKIETMSSTEMNASAAAIMKELTEDRFAIVQTVKPYSKEELKKYKLPKSFTSDELLKITSIRYLLSTTSYQKYVPVTIARNVNEKTVALITEHAHELEGVAVAEDSTRVYNDATYFSSLLGYTGKVSTDELEKLDKERKDYSSSSIVGKTGIEEVMETTLQGIDGSETVYVDNLGKVLQIDRDSKEDPQAGKDVYLTIDKKLQEACYKILEQRIAGILVANIQPIKEFEASEDTDTSAIPIPIYDVYYALIKNNILDIDHFSLPEASATEAAVYEKFTQRRQEIFDQVRSELTGENPKPYKELSKEMQSYMSYIVNELLMKETGILNSDAIDTTDDMYIAWTKEETISLQEYLTYAASKNWIDISKFTDENTYLDTRETYNALSDFISKYLTEDHSFSRLLYKYLLLDDVISGNELCMILYDQGVLSKDDNNYGAFAAGELNSYDLLIAKITNLEITPAQLALDPCSGSVVVTNPQTGEIEACVTYPGYDNNKLANSMDVAYYQKLNADLSEPFYNKATQQRTAPGSTFKLITTVAGLSEGVITDDSTIQCTGLFDKIEGSPLRCWYRAGHGLLQIRGGISNSCNVFFSEVAYRLGLNGSGVFSDTAAMAKIQSYAELFNMDKNSGIEISEADPKISKAMPIPSSIGQGTHNFTTSQLARYVTTLANAGTSYRISLLDKVTSPEGKTVKDFSPGIESQLEVNDYIWDDIHTGMRGVITETNKELFQDLNTSLAGKTGTAQQESNRPSHGLFIGYAPYEDPKLSIAVRIAYGYSSQNAGLVAKDIINYAFNLKSESDIITGTANSDSVTSEQTD